MRQLPTLEADIMVELSRFNLESESKVSMQQLASRSVARLFWAVGQNQSGRRGSSRLFVV